MTDKNELNARVLKKTMIHDELMVLSVEYLEGEIPEFRPGQFGTLGMPGVDDPRLIRRAYSIASSSKNLKSVDYFITLVKDGALTPKLFALNVGDKLWMAKKITGHFTLDDVPPKTNLVLIGTGTGLGPFVSMSETFPLGLEDQKTTLIHGVRFERDLGYVEELSAMEKNRPGFFYRPIVSRAQSWTGMCGRVQNCWNKELFKKDWGFEPSPQNTHIFLCGNPEMVKDMTALLESEGYKQNSRKEPGQIHIEKYW
jgi:ferredoxin--NADP+ reductase